MIQKEATILGLDIGGTKTAVVLGTADGTIRHKTAFPTNPGRGFSATYAELAGAVEKTIAASGGVDALSVSIGGPLDILAGVIKSPPNLPGWTDIPLKKMLAEQFGLPVFVEHDGNAGALAEYYFGAGRGFKNIVFLTMGTGLGAGLILDGRVYRGSSDTAGEVGHIRIAEHGPRCYDKPGSLEGFGSGTGIARLAQMMHPKIWGPASTALDVYKAFTQGAAEALEVFDRASLYFGRGLAIMADILNPQRIILGGIGMRINDALVEPAKQVFAREALPEARAVCEIVPAELGESIGDVASLCAALDQGKFRHSI